MKIEAGMVRTLTQLIPTNRRVTKSIGLLIVSVTFLLSGGLVHASCASAPTFNASAVIFPQTITVPPNPPAGTILATKTINVASMTAGTTFASSCTGSTTVYFRLLTVADATIANRVVPTSVQGVGITAKLSGVTGNDLAVDSSFTSTASSLAFASQVALTVNLVATGEPITGGALVANPQPLAGTGSSMIGYLYVSNVSYSLAKFGVASPNTTIVTSGCSVTTTSPKVTLDPITPRSLTGVGSTAGGTATSIALNCGNSASRVSITLTDSTSSTNRGSTLSTTADSTASGVGLQILNQAGTPVSFGNQWVVSASASGLVNIPLTARYVQTAATVKPGTVKGIATFTMAYQ